MTELKEWFWYDALNEDPVGTFHKLRKLIIKGCPKLIGKLPNFLPSLEELEISGCKQLTDLPGVLPSLKKLCISGCGEAVLRNLTNVPCLTELEIERMEGLITLKGSFLKIMAALEKLEINGCSELTCLLADGIDLDYLTSLKNLRIRECEKLVSLVNVERRLLPFNLEYLNVSSCDRLKEINLNGLNSLKNLNIRNCPSVRCSPNGKLTDSLKSLSIHRVEKQLIESFHNYGFSHLTNLSISECDKLKSFPERELANIPTLVSLNLSDCKKLKSLTNHMQSFPNLQSLEIYGCGELESFPESGLPNHSLVFFVINSCSNLRSLPNQMQSLTSLQELEIRSSDQISSLEGSLPPNLTGLYIFYCGVLSQTMAEWGLHTLTSLRVLAITSNSDMEECQLH